MAFCCDKHRSRFTEECKIDETKKFAYLTVLMKVCEQIADRERFSEYEEKCRAIFNGSVLREIHEWVISSSYDYDLFLNYICAYETELRDQGVVRDTQFELMS